MKRSFNVTGLCIPEKHYMVDLTDRIRQIRKMVDAGDYFTINCARQYGKTTTLTALAKAMDQEYLVVSLDYEVDSASNYQVFLDFLAVWLCKKMRAEKLCRQTVSLIPCCIIIFSQKMRCALWKSIRRPFRTEISLSRESI